MTGTAVAVFGVAVLSIPLGLDRFLPTPEDNPLAADRVALGRDLFNDRRLSRDGTISCATCHRPGRAFTDGRVVAVGVAGRRGRRNVPTLVNRAWGQSFFWDARAPTLEEQVLRPIEDGDEMDLALSQASTRVGVSTVDMARGLASYVRSILSGDSPYDRFVAGDMEALTAEQQVGLRIFQGKGNCTACHVGPTFSDERLHNTGVAWRDGRLTDDGGGRGRFKTPTLREVARTAPYMHDGSMTTLEEAVDYYDRGGNRNPALDPQLRPLRLGAAEKRALVSFLRGLTGEIQEGWRSAEPPRPRTQRDGRPRRIADFGSPADGSRKTRMADRGKLKDW